MGIEDNNILQIGSYTPRAMHANSPKCWYKFIRALERTPGFIEVMDDVSIPTSYPIYLVHAELKKYKAVWKVSVDMIGYIEFESESHKNLFILQWS